MCDPLALMSEAMPLHDPMELHLGLTAANRQTCFMGYPGACSTFCLCSPMCICQRLEDPLALLHVPNACDDVFGHRGSHNGHTPLDRCWSMFGSSSVQQQVELCAVLGFVLPTGNACTAQTSTRPGTVPHTVCVGQPRSVKHLRWDERSCVYSLPLQMPYLCSHLCCKCNVNDCLQGTCRHNGIGFVVGLWNRVVECVVCAAGSVCVCFDCPLMPSVLPMALIRVWRQTVT